MGSTNKHLYYVKVGRLVRILRGPRENKVGIVTAIVDSNRVLVENPSDDKMWRHVQNMKNIECLKFAVPLSENAPTTQVKAALEKKDILSKWNTTTKAKGISAKIALAQSTDFERYQLRVAKRSRAHWSRKLFAEADAKKPVSFEMKKLRKMEKAQQAYVGKKFGARGDRIKKFFAARKARKGKK